MLTPDSCFSEFAAEVTDFQRDPEALLRTHSPSYLKLHGLDLRRRIADRHKQMLPPHPLYTLYNRCVSSSFTVRKMAEADFPTRWGHFRIMGFAGQFGPDGVAGDRRKEEAVALVMGNIHAAAPLVRIHSQCLTGDVFGSLRSG